MEYTASYQNGCDYLKFFIYSRKSVYTGRGDSIESQIELCRRFILLKYPETLSTDIYIYEDEGFSGKNLNRPQFQKMYDDFSTINPDFLVCYRLDRISRSIGDFATLFEDLNQKGIAFLCIKENFDTSTPMGKAMLYITSVFAQLERETIAERVRDNMHQLARTGRWLGGTPPLGFTVEHSEQHMPNGHNKYCGELRVQPKEQAVVRTIFAQFLALRSVSAVQKYLQQNGILSRSGRNFSAIGLKDILKNPIYCTADEDAYSYFSENRADISFSTADCRPSNGLMAYNKRNYSTQNAPRLPMDKWIIAIGSHSGLISGAQWVATQHLLLTNQSNGSSKRFNDYALLSGDIRCALCGSRMFAKRRSNRDGQFDYICEKKLQYGASVCSSFNLNGQRVDACILNKAINTIDFPRLTKAERHFIAKSLALSLQNNPLHPLNTQITLCNQELERLTFCLTQNELSTTFIQCVNQKMDELALKRAQLEADYAALLTAVPNRDAIPSLCRQPSDIAHLPLQSQRDFLRCIVDYVQWDGVQLHLHLRED